MTKRVVIDCDPGLDDALALILARRFAEIVGITTVSGNGPLHMSTQNALRICDLIGLDVPVHQGSSRPLIGNVVHALEVHGADGLGDLDLPFSNRQASSTDAVSYLLELTDTDTWVIALGPLTNIAKAISRDETWAQRVAGVAVMGGSRTFGNITRYAEFNTLHDPEAARLVFESPLRMRMCGLDVTETFNVDSAYLKAYADTVPTDHWTVRAFAAAAVQKLHRSVSEITGIDAVAIHDPVAVFSVTHAAEFEFERCRIDVELRGEFTRGMTVIDTRPIAPDKRDSGTVEVAVRANVTALHRSFREVFK